MTISCKRCNISFDTDNAKRKLCDTCRGTTTAYYAEKETQYTLLTDIVVAYQLSHISYRHAIDKTQLGRKLRKAQAYLQSKGGDNLDKS